MSISVFFFFNDTATTEIYTLSLHDALPICSRFLPSIARTWAAPCVGFRNPACSCAPATAERTIATVRALQPAFRRARSARTVAIVRSAVARAHEQAGLRKPTHGAAQVRAIDGKNLELLSFDAPHPARCVHGLAVGRRHVGISKRGEARLTLWELADVAERHPGKVGTCAPLRNRGKKKSNDRYRKSRRAKSIEH